MCLLLAKSKILNCISHSILLLPLPPNVKEVMFSPISVCLSVCLFVCLFVCVQDIYLKKLWTDPDEILWTVSVCDKDELIRFR